MDSRKENLTIECISACLCLLVFLFLFITGGLLNSLISTSEVVQEIEVQGFSTVKVEERTNFFANWKGCGKDDDIALRFDAINPKGEKVERLLACRGGWSLFPVKGTSVRSDKLTKTVSNP